MSEGSMFSVKFSDNWADEMDVDGHRVMTVAEKDAYLKYVSEEVAYPTTFSIGTNEEIEYESAEEVLAVITFTSITEEQAAFLKELGLDNQGFFPDEDYI